MKKFIFIACLILSTSSVFASRCLNELERYYGVTGYHQNLEFLFAKVPEAIANFKSTLENYDELSRNGTVLGADRIGTLNGSVGSFNMLLRHMQMEVQMVDAEEDKLFKNLSACMTRETNQVCEEAVKNLQTEAQQVYQVNYTHVGQVALMYGQFTQYSRQLDQSISSRTVVPGAASIIRDYATYLSQTYRKQELEKAIDRYRESKTFEVVFNCVHQ